MLISVIVASPTSWEAYHSPRLRLGPWWVSQFVGEATKTSVLVSIPKSVPELKLIHASKRGHWWHYPDCKVHWDIMGPIWGRQDPGGPHVGPMNSAFWVVSVSELFQHWFKWWFGSCSATNENPVNQWPFRIYWTLGNKITWNMIKIPKVSFLSCLDDPTNDNLVFVLGQWVH